MTIRSRSAAMTAGVATRTFALEDIHVRSSGDGRTVEAYAAVFDQPTEVNDQDGRYSEVIDRAAFNRTVSHRGTNFQVFFNHGMTLHGTPSERHSMPIGTPLEVRSDSRGLLTVTRYNKTSLAEEVLEGIREGSIRGQSFTGRMLRSTPRRGSAPFRARSTGELTTVTRQEIGLIEYGPTPLPYYEGAAIVGLRAATLSDTDEMLLQLILANLAEGDAALDPIVSALCKTDAALEQALIVLSQILSTPNPDVDNDLDRSAYLTRLRSLAARLEGASARSTTTGTPATGPATADAPDDLDEAGEHSGPTLTRAQIRARLHRNGVLS